MINEQSVRQWWGVFKADNPLTEIRILGNGKTFSGYYTDVESILRDIRQYDGYGIYATINAVKESCYGRFQHDCMVQKPKETTSDNDIDHRTTLLIDIDPKRTSGTNSTDAEKQRALDKAREVYKYLRGQGFANPVVADSGNGYHLYYRVSMPNSPEAAETTKLFLLALDMMFSDDFEGGALIDTTVFNAARIAKLIGTTSNKGANTDTRPRRLSGFINIPDVILQTDFSFVRNVAETYPKQEPPSRHNNYSGEPFDLRAFIAKHSIGVAKETRFSGGTKFVLQECPFNPNHKAPDSALFLLDDGAIAFRCLHASCHQYHWRDFRLHFEPDSYAKSDRQEYEYKRRYYAKVKPEDFKPAQEDERGKKWKMAGEFEKIDYRKLPKIPMGIPELDKRMRGGLFIGETTIVSGSSGAGKTTFLNHLILNAVERNFRVALWSGEMLGSRVISWLDQAAAGVQNLEYDAGLDCYITPTRIANKVNDWLGDRFYLYNNSYGQKFEQLIADIKECVEQNKVQLVMIDNRMSLDLDDYASDENTRDRKFITTISDLAKEAGIHVIVVCHPRKENLTQIIRKESIAGSADLTNRCDNLILLHRVNRDFDVRAQSIFSNQQIASFAGFNLIVELNKARTPGVTDFTVGMYYEEESRRLRSAGDIIVNYGWDEQPVQQAIAPPEDMPDFESETNKYYDNF